MEKDQKEKEKVKKIWPKLYEIIIDFCGKLTVLLHFKKHNDKKEGKKKKKNMAKIVSNW